MPPQEHVCTGAVKYAEIKRKWVFPVPTLYVNLSQDFLFVLNYKQNLQVGIFPQEAVGVVLSPGQRCL